MKIRVVALARLSLELGLVWLAISFAVPVAMAQDAMKVVTADELVWKEHPVFKGAQTVILVGDPTKAETIVQRVKFPPHFKVPPHTHPYSEVVNVLRGCLKSHDLVNRLSMRRIAIRSIKVSEVCTRCS